MPEFQMPEFDQDQDEYDMEKISQVRRDAIRRYARELGMTLGVDKADIAEAILSVLSEDERKQLNPYASSSAEGASAQKQDVVEFCPECQFHRPRNHIHD